jgi:hypothetical protein
MRDNWQATLILWTEAGASVVGRFEYHGSHPGLHVHADCERGGLGIDQHRQSHEAAPGAVVSQADVGVDRHHFLGGGAEVFPRR